MKQIKGTLFVIMSAVLFGLMPLMANTIYENGGNAVMLAFFRNLFALPLLYVLMRRQTGKDYMIKKRQLRDLAILAVGFAATPVLLYLSYYYIPSGMATTIHFIYPAFVLIGCLFVFKERPEPLKIVCTAVCIIGVALFYSPDDGTGNLLGILLSFLSGITFAVYIVGVDKSCLRGMTAFQMAFFLSLTASILLFFTAIIGGWWTVDFTPLGWVMTVLFSQLIAIGASVLFQTGIKTVGPQRAAILSTFEPVTGIAVGFAVFSEELTLMVLIGSALILAAVVLLTRYGGGKKDIEAP